MPGLITEGLVFIAGKSDLGKSWWSLQLAIAKAQGGKAFGVIDVEAGDVLYLSLEDDAQAMQERVQACLEEGEAWPARLTIAHEAPLLSQGLSERLEAWLKSHPQAHLIIIDVLQKIRPPRRQHGDIYEQDYAIGEALKPLARRYHVAIIILHHCNKLVSPEDPLDAVSGSTGLIAPADVKAVFTRARGKADAKLFITGRAIREQWAAFEFDEGLWTYLGDAAEAERSDARQAIIDLLRQAEGPMTPKAIATRLGKNERPVRVLLFKMKTRDEVQNRAPGYYAVPQPPSSPSTPVNAINAVNAINGVNSVNAPPETAQEPGSVYAPEATANSPVNAGSAENFKEKSAAFTGFTGFVGLPGQQNTREDPPPPPTPADDHQTLDARPPVPEKANGRPQVIHRNRWTFRTLEQVRAEREARMAALRAAGQQPTHCCRCHEPLQAGQYHEIFEHDTLKGECWRCIQALS